ncbi:MAG: hypothetical protein ACKO5C_00400 [Ferruginibacter sp.]
MQINKILGKQVIDISTHLITQGNLDQADIFIELHGGILLDTPWNGQHPIQPKEKNKQAKSIFKDLTDIPVFHLNPGGKSIDDIAIRYQQKINSLPYKIANLLFGYQPRMNEYLSHKVTYVENKWKYVKGRTIVDFLWYPACLDQRGFLLLDNGYLISETNTAFAGTGMAGMHYYESLNTLELLKGTQYERLTNFQNLSAS